MGISRRRFLAYVASAGAALAAGACGSGQGQRASGSAIRVPSSFSYEAIPYLSEKANLPYSEARLPGAPIRVSHNIEKARSLLGYRPRYDMRRIIDSAVG
jgi:hypothetical protein